MNTPEQQHYWRQNIRLILSLLAVWVVVSLGASILFVEKLNEFTLGSLPLGFWMAQQGAIYIFVILILIYAKVMDRIDRNHHLSMEDETGQDS